MKNRQRSTGAERNRIEVQMAPMIDVVFQLLIFFMLTLKIIQPEGHFDVRMPVGVAPPDLSVPLSQDIKVRLTANEDGSLEQVYLGSNPLGSDSPVCFQRLNQEIGELVYTGGNLADDIVVEIDAAYNLDYEYTVKAVSSCLGRVDPDTRRRVNYVSNIRFKPPDRRRGFE